MDEYEPVDAARPPTQPFRNLALDEECVHSFEVSLIPNLLTSHLGMKTLLPPPQQQQPPLFPKRVHQQSPPLPPFPPPPLLHPQMLPKLLPLQLPPQKPPPAPHPHTKTAAR